ncbi:MAG: PIG-L family deacetylase [Acidobacteria bacterium]|nr:PIG-L family deacetylase [Acidobacteriota bacterium]
MRSFLVLAGCALLVAAAAAGPDALAQDKGAAGTWQRLLKLQTTASLMHTTAHPDDEHGGMLAQMSRGRGARVSLLTLTRGEAGDNAIGPELFDALGLIRTEELLIADRYYGVDQQYFTTAIDYGFSKRLDEALEKWGRENVLRDIVRVIRMERPFVLVARFQGNERDGHGNHQAAGLLTQEAYRIAGDPTVFPEQIRAGLHPWQPLKLYMGGVRENEDWTLRVDTGEYSPWLGDTYAAFARTGLSFQRSQNGGRVAPPQGPAFTYYKRLASRVAAPEKENSFFAGIDTTIPGLFGALGRRDPPGAADLLAAIDGHVQAAVRAFSMADPSASVPALAQGLQATRTAIARLADDHDAAHVLRIKEQQFQDAINTAVGVELQAIAAVPGPLVAGQHVSVDVVLTNHGTTTLENPQVSLAASAAWNPTGFSTFDSGLAQNSVLRRMLTVVVPRDATPTRPYFERDTIVEARYKVRDAAQMFRPAAEPPVSAVARYQVAGVVVEARSVTRRLEPHVPYGDEWRELTVVPAVAVNVTPRIAVVPLGLQAGAVDIVVELVNNLRPEADDAAVHGIVEVRLPSGMVGVSGSAGSEPFTFTRPGERSTHRFHFVPREVAGGRDYWFQVVATVAGRAYSEGYDAIEHRDLETRYLYRSAGVLIRGIDVKIAPKLKVGYVMGIGDEVPGAIAQLGASVTLLGEPDLARGDLRQYDAIVTGTRAYAVRDDLKTYNRRLLDYVKEAGNLIVLYNTQELVPNEFAPYPGVLTARAEEVSEEDSPVEILAPAHRVLTTPNTITAADFNGWVEQRGSKFWSEWDRAYTPIIATHDIGQPWQRGGWLTAEYGKGHYTYFAYAFHRQLPYGVPGAYRLLANLLSLGK